MYDRGLCSERPVPATTPTPVPPFAGVDHPPATHPGARPDPAAAWQTPIGGLPGVRPAVAERAHAFGLHTVGDLLRHIPSRYEHYEASRSVADVAVGQEVTVRVVLDSIRSVPTRRRGFVLIKASVFDNTGRLHAVWFNQRYLLRALTPGDVLMLRGTIQAGTPRQITVKAHEVLGQGASAGLHTEGLVPVYPATEALPSARIRELVDLARPYVRAGIEALPAWVRHELGLMSQPDTIMAAHFPRTTGEAAAARRRLVVEEFVVLLAGLLIVRRREAEARAAPVLAATHRYSDPLLATLPFSLTPDQTAARDEIAADLAQPRPMRRLIQGEVGSGKTLVAALAICQAMEADTQAVLLAPTETLAEQHLRTFDDLLAPVGDPSVVPVLVTGKVPAAERQRRLMDLRTGTKRLAIGTQALLSEGVAFDNLGLVVVDEQHRFGVEQRHALSNRALGRNGAAAHILYMTATPIPRTLALTAFGDLTVSTIARPPRGRGAVTTRWVRDDDREQAYEDIREALRDGRQAYVICPLVSEGESESRAATAEYELLRTGPFRDFTVGLAHGAMKSDEKRAAMEAFARGETQLLVATTVVEVGIDVPNATVMMIEGAERFGLAQLHQLRGRIGRGRHPGLCLVVADEVTEDGARRLEAFTETTDGFRLSELDLQLRGEGAVLGLRQSGMTDLRYGRLAHDTVELEQALDIARRLLADDPDLCQPANRLLGAAVDERFRDVVQLLHA